MNNTKRASAWAIGVLMASLPGAVMAQQAPMPSAAPETPTTAQSEEALMERDAHGNNVFRSRIVFNVRGEIQRPYPFNVSGRAPLGYQYTDDRRSFVRDAVDAVRRNPF